VQGRKGVKMNPYDEDEAAGVRLEQLRECNPTLARATRIIAAHPRQAAELFIALPRAVYPHAVRAVLAEMDDNERIALAELLDDPEVENALHYLVLLACPPLTEDEDADDSKPVT
jgi:hypothetical protein